MSVHLPKKKIELKEIEGSKAKSDSKPKLEAKDPMKSGDAAVVYKNKNHRIKKELTFSKSKGSKGLA